MASILSQDFFDRDPQELAIALLGKVLRHRWVGDNKQSLWLAAQIIETEAYYQCDKASHASLGYTQSRKALFMPAGTIYMYYARGRDSLNFSARGEGNAVLIKSGFPYFDEVSPKTTLDVMQRNNPGTGDVPRKIEKLCNGQTLVCKSLGLTVLEWSQREADPSQFRIESTGYEPDSYIQCPRLGIPVGRDEHLPYRFVDERYAKFSTKNPLTTRQWRRGRDYKVVAR